MKPIHKLLALAFFSVSVLAWCNLSDACTAFQLQAKDGSWVYFRSMEFGIPLSSEILIVPRGTAYTGTAAGGAAGLKWTAKYGLIGPNQYIATNLMSDGMNERGLVVGMLLFPGFAQYPESDPAKTDITIGSWEVAAYLLSTCGSLEECRTALTDGSVYISNVEFAPFGGILPVHYYIADRTGAVLIAEYVGGKLQLHENPLGVLTNAPGLEWQTTNLANFANLSPVNAPGLQLHNDKVQSFGQGSGALGLPGDLTPPSRFVRAALFSNWAEQGATATETVLAGFHVLNTFDIFSGAVRASAASEQVETQKPEILETERTQWTVAHDRGNLRTYVRTYESLSVQVIDLKKIDFTKPGLRQIQLKKEFEPEDLSETAKPLE